MLHALSPMCNPSQLQNSDVDIFLYGIPLPMRVRLAGRAIEMRNEQFMKA